MKTMTIALTEDNRLTLTASTPLTPADVINLSLNACLSAMTDTLANSPEELKTDIKEHLFDLFNMTASSLLSQFAPEIDLRPDFDYDAIMDLSTRRATEQIKQKRRQRG